MLNNCIPSGYVLGMIKSGVNWNSTPADVWCRGDTEPGFWVGDFSQFESCVWLLVISEKKKY